MKTTLLILGSLLLLSGCRTVEAPTATKAVYPVPPASLSEFFKRPADGVYSIPESAVSEEELLTHNLIVVSGGATRLSRLENGRVSTNQWDLVEFRPALPDESTIQQIAAGTTERGVEGQLGKPNREGFDYYPIIRLKSGNTKRVAYSWFSVSERSQLTFMRVNVYYKKSKDGDWRVESLDWGKWGGQKFSSNHPAGGNAGAALQLAIETQWPGVPQPGCWPTPYL